MNKTIFLYSLDFHGFGHITRNIRLAEKIAEKYPTYKIYLLSNKFFIQKRLPKNVKKIKLPLLNIKKKAVHCRFSSKPPKQSKIWTNFLMKLITKHKPNIFYVDLFPGGAFGELREVLLLLSKMRIKKIIGLRDIRDNIKRTEIEWFNKETHIPSVLDYDEILIFGEKYLFMKLYSSLIPNLKKFTFVGYLLPPFLKKDYEKKIDVFCLFGGGGKSMIQVNYLAKVLNKLSKKVLILLTGPLYPKKEFKKLKKRYKNIKFIMKTKKVQKYILKSKLTITHGGYNSLMDSLQYSNNLLMFPREGISQEQNIRAKYFKQKGICDYISLKNNVNYTYKKIVRYLKIEEKLQSKLKFENKRFVKIFK